MCLHFLAPALRKNYQKIDWERNCPNMRLIHSSDLQIGKVFGFMAPDIAVLLQDARQTVAGTLGQLAMEHGASDILLAGDIYDKQQPSQVTLAKPIEAMRRFAKVTWHLLPGNHDCVRENGLWARLIRSNLPDNIRLHLNPGAVAIPSATSPQAFILPAPLKFISSSDDLTNYMDREPTPEGAIRIGLAHGSIAGFGSEGDAANYIPPTRADQAGLAYLALGDWHRQIRINDRTWYSGTPEPDQFKRPPGDRGSLCNGGAALLVDIAGTRAIPTVTPLETGRYRWRQIVRTITEDSDVARLEQELRALDVDPSRTVLNLRVDGVLSLAGRKEFEERIAGSIRAAFCGLRLDDSQLALDPTEADLDDIDRAGFVRVAADRLKAMAADPSDAKRAEIAAIALKRLYIEHLRQAGRP
jgi:DNA repair exonuclease SbcCD nuclease subunit